MIITKVEYLYDRLVPVVRCTWDTDSSKLNIDAFRQELNKLGYVRIPSIIQKNKIHTSAIEDVLSNDNCTYGSAQYFFKEWLSSKNKCLIKINNMWFDPTIRHWFINADCYDVTMTF